MRSLLIFYGIFATIGSICFLISAFTFYSTIEKRSSWVSDKGSISGFHGSSPIIKFSYYGEEREFESSYSSSGMQTGDEIEIFYPPGHPEEAEVKSFFTEWFIPLFLLLFALVFGAVGFIGGSKQWRRFNAKRDLFVYGKGRKSSLPITDIIKDTSFSVNGRNPYVIICQYHDKVGNQIHEFKSDHIWYNPTEVLGQRKELDVYIDPNDLTYYYLDITFLPKKL